MYHENEFVVNIAKSRLSSVAPNRRGSVATSARVVRELCASRAWGLREGSAKWVITAKKDEHNQGSEVPNKNKKKNKNKKREVPPPDGAMFVAETLWTGILTVQPDRKLPYSLDSWAWTYDKAMRLDKRDTSVLLAQIDWLFSPVNQSAEARFEVFSAEAHRKKFDAIERQRTKQPTTQRRPGMVDRIAEGLAERQEKRNAQGSQQGSAGRRLTPRALEEGQGDLLDARDVSPSRGDVDGF